MIRPTPAGCGLTVVICNALDFAQLSLPTLDLVVDWPQDAAPIWKIYRIR